MKKNGFTLVELLAVIIILAIVMLIGVTAVVPVVNKAQRNSLVSEGLSLIDVAKTAYQAEQSANLNSSLKLYPTTSYCFSLDWLKNKNYYDGNSKKYTGSVLVAANKDGQYDYYFWITNGNYHISGGTADNYTIEDGPGDQGIYSCGSATGGDGSCTKSERIVTLSKGQCANFCSIAMVSQDSDASYDEEIVGCSCEGAYGIVQHRDNYSDDILLPFGVGDLVYNTDYDIVNGYHDTYYPLYNSGGEQWEMGRNASFQSNEDIDYEIKPVAYYSSGYYYGGDISINIYNAKGGQTLTFNYENNTGYDLVLTKVETNTRDSENSYYSMQSAVSTMLSQGTGSIRVDISGRYVSLYVGTYNGGGTDMVAKGDTNPAVGPAVKSLTLMTSNNFRYNFDTCNGGREVQWYTNSPGGSVYR